MKVVNLGNTVILLIRINPGQTNCSVAEPLEFSGIAPNSSQCFSVKQPSSF